MILCIGPTPAAQRVMLFQQLVLDSVNRAASTFDGAAGKAINVAKVLKALGEQPTVTGFLGGDRGEEIRKILESKAIAHDFVNVAERTRLCTTLLDQTAETQTELVEESRSVTTEHYESLKAIVRRRLVGCRAAVMSGTLTPGGPASFYFECVQMTHAVGALSVVDAQGSPLIEALKAGPGLVKPNRAELAATIGRAFPGESALREAMRELIARGAQRVVITAGKEPALAHDGKSFWRVRSPKIHPTNPIGSGDSFTAALVWRLLKGESLGEACRWASAAGAANALTLMAGEVELDEVEKLVKASMVEQIE